MRRFVEGVDRSQTTLFPEALDDWIGEDNPVRVIDSFVDALDLAGLGFASVVPQVIGRPSYHPSVLLKLYIYGYLNRVQSSRRLELEAIRNVELMWLTGRLTPDHKTIANFRKDNGRAIRQVCAQFVALCRKLGLLNTASVAIDGSKFKVVNNRDKIFTRAKSVRCIMTADLESKPRGQSPDMKQRAPWSRFRGVVTTPSCNTTDLRSFFDQCASTGSPEQHGHPQRLLEYRLALVRRLARPRPTDVVLDLGCGNGHHLLALAPEVARGIGIDVSPGMIELARARLRYSPWIANLTFEVDDAEELKGIADQSIDLAICIGAFEHMLDKRAVLASIHRVLKLGGRFFCLTPDADYVWYRTFAPVLGFATNHLSSDRMLTRDEFSALLDLAGFRHIRYAPWTFIPKGDVPAIVALLLAVLDAIGRNARVDSLRGGLSIWACKEAEPI
jgi:transposase/ubiquinone/menaquinone biosynthesis C-methylase UbiE